MTRIHWIAAGCVLTLAACDKPTPTPETKPAENAATHATPQANTAAAAAAQPAQPTVAETDIATPADFEEAAEKSITAKTYKAELAMLQSAIDKE